MSEVFSSIGVIEEDVLPVVGGEQEEGEDPEREDEEGEEDLFVM